MKIGFVFDDTLDKPDGVQQYMITLRNWLVAHGHEVHFLVGHTKRMDIANVHSLSRNIGVRFNGNQLSIPLPVAKVKLRNFLMQEQFDVLHVQMPYSPQFAARVIAAAPTGTGIVGTFHILPYGFVSAIGARLLGLLTWRSLRRFDHVVAVSPAAQQFAEQSMHITAEVVPNAVDVSHFKWKDKTPAKVESNLKTILYLGRLVPRKGCMQLLKAVAQLQSQNQLGSARIIIGGDGPERERLEVFTKAHALEDHVQFVGQVAENKKADFLSQADVAVLPSIAGESFGIIVVEAIASGAGVIIGGDNPGYRYVLGDTTEMLVDPMKTDDLAATIICVLANAKLRQSLGDRQRKHIEQFDIERVGPRIEDIYISAQAKRGKV